MTRAGMHAVLGAGVACCAGKALLLTAVLAAGGVLTATRWLMGAAVTVAALGVWQTMAALRHRGERS